MRRRVAVIGCGAAGTLAAVHLMRAAGPSGVEILLIDREGEFGPGVAYGTDDPLHLLNVPAARMGAIAGEPTHFQAWLERRGPGARPESFQPRRLFGGYLRELLAETELASVGRAHLRRLQGDVVSLAEPFGADGRLELQLAGGERLGVDCAVLALGPLPGDDPVAITEEMRESGIYVSDPWARGALATLRGAESVLVVGTGLTMVDVALSLGRPDRGPVLRAVSRNGLVPRSHRADLTTLRPFPLPHEGADLDAVVAVVLEQIGRIGRQGGDWRDVLDSMRPATPALWRGLPLTEKRRFLGTMQRFWDVHRFRMAPPVAARFGALRESGRLRVDAGAIVALEPSARGVRATLRLAGRDTVEVADFDRVVNCSGSGADLLGKAPPLLADLLAAGLARPDQLGIGLDVAPSGALVDRDGRPSPRIHVVGCLRKGVEWEAIGVTEIRDQAATIARELLPSAAEGVAA